MKSSAKENMTRKRIEVVITGLTRNQVARKGSWVRIPPLPPRSQQCERIAGFFLFIQKKPSPFGIASAEDCFELYSR